MVTKLMPSSRGEITILFLILLSRLTSAASSECTTRVCVRACTTKQDTSDGFFEPAPGASEKVKEFYRVLYFSFFFFLTLSASGPSPSSRPLRRDKAVISHDPNN